MLISHSYYTYRTNDEYVGGTANINSSSNIDSIFELEMININKELNGEGLRAFINTEDRSSSSIKQSFYIYDNNDQEVGFGFIRIKEA